MRNSPVQKPVLNQGFGASSKKDLHVQRTASQQTKDSQDGSLRRYKDSPHNAAGNT